MKPVIIMLLTRTKLCTNVYYWLLSVWLSCFFLLLIFADSLFLQTSKVNHVLCSSNAAGGNCHKTDKASQWGGEGRFCNPQQTEGARAPLRHYRRAVLAGTPWHPGAWQPLRPEEGGGLGKKGPRWLWTDDKTARFEKWSITTVIYCLTAVNVVNSTH